MLRFYIALMALVCLPVPCWADYQFEFDQATDFDSSQAGNLVSVDLFLSEIGGDVTFNGTNKVEFNLTAGAGGSTITGFNVNDAFGGNPFLPGAESSTAAAIQGGVAVRLYNVGGVAPTNGRVLLGQLGLQLGATGSATPLSFEGQLTTPVSEPGRNILAFIIGSGATPVALDSQVFSPGNSYSVNVAAVPEPGSVGLFGALLLGASFYRRKS